MMQKHNLNPFLSWKFFSLDNGKLNQLNINQVIVRAILYIEQYNYVCKKFGYYLTSVWGLDTDLKFIPNWLFWGLTSLGFEEGSLSKLK